MCFYAFLISKFLNLFIIFPIIIYLLVGWLKDETGHYQTSFYFAGASMVMGSLVINIPTVRKWSRSRTKKPVTEYNKNQVYEDNTGFNHMETGTSCRL